MLLNAILMVSLVCLSLFLKKWQPEEFFTFDGMKIPTKRHEADYTTGPTSIGVPSPSTLVSSQYST